MTRKDFTLVAEILGELYKEEKIAAVVIVRFSNKFAELFPRFNADKFLNNCIAKKCGPPAYG